MLEIKEPIWNSRSVGIALHRLGMINTDMEILYKNKEGKRIYPHVYTLKTEIIKKYPKRMFQGVEVFIVPIKDFGVKIWRQP